MTKRHDLLRARPASVRDEPHDPDALEALAPLERPESFMETVDRMVRLRLSGALAAEEPVANAQIDDWLDDIDEEDQVLSDYQLTVIAHALEAEQAPAPAPPAPAPPAAPEVAPPAVPGDDPPS